MLFTGKIVDKFNVSTAPMLIPITCIVSQVDANFVICESGKIAEIQTTGEEYFFSRDQFNSLFELANNGINEIIIKQKKALLL